MNNNTAQISNNSNSVNGGVRVRNNNTVSTANSSTGPNKTSAQKVSNIGSAIANIGATREELGISWNTIGLITVLGLIYVIASSIGIGLFAKCDKFKDKTMQQNLNKWLIGTLGVAIAVPFTIVLLKTFSNEAAVFTLFYAILGIIASSVSLNWTVNCDESTKESRNTVIISLVCFIVMLMFGVFLMLPKGKSVVA